jgi:hypothetical protein
MAPFRGASLSNQQRTVDRQRIDDHGHAALLDRERARPVRVPDAVGAGERDVARLRGRHRALAREIGDVGHDARRRRRRFVRARQAQRRAQLDLGFVEPARIAQGDSQDHATANFESRVPVAPGDDRRELRAMVAGQLQRESRHGEAQARMAQQDRIAGGPREIGSVDRCRCGADRIAANEMDDGRGVQRLDLAAQRLEAARMAPRVGGERQPRAQAAGARQFDGAAGCGGE